MNGALLRCLLLLWLLTLAACANIVPPTGGEKDVTPPKLRSISPADSQLNVRIKKIDLIFDEYIALADASAQVHISPLLPIPLTVTSSGKRVTIIIPDTLLQDATTYRVTFGSAIRDIHEGNVWPGSGYTFSTGGYFDSLAISGTVFDARTGLHDSTAQVMLYAAGDGDSAVVRHKPLYVVHADAAGTFLLQGLPARPFLVYALRDANGNLTFDGGAEWIAFYDTIITPVAGHPADIELRTFPEVLSDSDALKAQRTEPARGLKAASVPPGRYTVSADTSDPKKRTQDLNAPLLITCGRKPAVGLNDSKIFLLMDSAGTTVEAPLKIAMNDTSGLQYSLTTPWREDVVYTLRLQKGFAQDSTGTDLLPGRYTFRTKRDEDYGKLRVHLPTRYYGRGHMLQVSNERDTIYQKAVADTIASLVRVPPGVYTLRVIEDKNGNGRWDAGDLFLRRQPELVVPYSATINLKAGWEQQIDFEAPRKRQLDDFSDR